MATYSAVIPSGSTSGKNIKIAATASPGTPLHTAHATDLDEITVDVTNTDTSARKVTIEWGGTTSPDDLIEQWIPPECGPVRVVTQRRLTGSLVVKAFADSANVLMAAVNVDRITA